MIQNLIFGILFLKVLFRACNFSPHVLVEIIRVILLQILKQKTSKPIKTSEKDYSFYNTVSLKNLTHFTNLNSFEIENDMPTKPSQKTFSVYKVSSKHVSV